MRLLVAPITAVEHLLVTETVDHVLTLASPDAEVAPLGIDRTVLRFNDIVEARPGLVAPDRAMVDQILRLGLSLRSDETLLIHCHAGVSRSTAGAYVLACAMRPPGEEAALAAILRQASPEATPNALMVALADQALGRSGAMIHAIAAIGRGVDCYEGSVVDWRLG